MKKKMAIAPTKLLARITLGTIAAIGMATLVQPIPILAEESNAADLQPPKPQDTPDGFSNTGGDRPPDFDMFDLIHRAQTGTLRSMEEFRAEQQQSINDAAAQFRAQQLQMLGNQQQPTSAEGAIAPAESTTVTPASN